MVRDHLHEIWVEKAPPSLCRRGYRSAMFWEALECHFCLCLFPEAFSTSARSGYELETFLKKRAVAWMAAAPGMWRVAVGLFAVTPAEQWAV